MRGTCKVCGCMDMAGCQGGCEWVDTRHELCSRCERPAGPIKDLLSLVTTDPPSVAQIRRWTNRQKITATAYAMALHFSAGDNIARIPPMPKHLKPFFLE